MNVPFTLADSALDAEFVKQAEARSMLNLKGHRCVGGMRASIYNAVSLEAVQALVSFMSEFENERG
jgi:phosphoserine aminotransferase